MSKTTWFHKSNFFFGVLSGLALLSMSCGKAKTAALINNNPNPYSGTGTVTTYATPTPTPIPTTSPTIPTYWTPQVGATPPGCTLTASVPSAQPGQPVTLTLTTFGSTVTGAYLMGAALPPNGGSITVTANPDPNQYASGPVQSFVGYVTGAGNSSATCQTQIAICYPQGPVPTPPPTYPLPPPPPPVVPVPPPPPPPPVLVGINYEDLVDNDYNDSVVCLSGGFQVQGSRVISFVPQQVLVKTSFISACDHRVKLKVLDEFGGIRTEIDYKSSERPEFPLFFGFGWSIEVEFYALGGCSTGRWVPQNDRRVRVGNFCNRTGI